MTGVEIEESKKLSDDIRSTFRKLFPLCEERDLPWAMCHIEGFLKKRIEQEIAAGAFARESRLVKILCEVSPLKSHIEDMARIVVEQAKLAVANRTEKGQS